jgi:predicted MFS family arabinose efflux permease
MSVEVEGPHAASDEMPPARLGLVVGVLALACGLSVANIYYAQPLLSLLGRDFGAGSGTVALVVTLTQLGYAAGLLLLVPLGDLLENRRLATRVLVGTSLALALAAASPGLRVFLVASLVVGLTSVVAQLLVPLAAHLAPEGQRGTVVGQVMSGLLLGILLARTVSSLLAAALSWRAVYALSAVLMLVVSVVLHRVLPAWRPNPGTSYAGLLRSLPTLLREEPALRWRAAYQICMFGAFSAFWTAVSDELVTRHGLSQAGVGIFALVGAAGAAAAPVAGRLGDRGRTRATTGAATALGALSMVLAGLGERSLVLLAVAGVLLDLAVQGNQVIGQRVIYGLRPDARARINTIYMASFFVAGAASSAAAGQLWERTGWTGVSVLAAALPTLAFALWLVESLRARGARR